MNNIRIFDSQRSEECMGFYNDVVFFLFSVSMYEISLRRKARIFNIEKGFR